VRERVRPFRGHRFASLLAAFALSVLLPAPALSQDISITLGGTGGGDLTSTAIGLFGLVTILSLAPGIAIMVTCFPFVVTVLSILRQAIGLQQAPPNMLIVSLSLFLSWYIMEPVFTEAWTTAGAPFANGTMPGLEAFQRGMEPFRAFMAARLDPASFAALAELRPATASLTDPETAPLSVLIPSFMLSEIARAFQIGFMVFLPFLVIDLVTSAVLMSMGMMMVPPAMVALPFKLAFFVVADGWTLLAGALVRSYG
jgi:flagellar biosynthetic protein FliP